MYKTKLSQRLEYERREAARIAAIRNKDERYIALAEFIRTGHDTDSRWSVEAVADVASKYLDAKSYSDFLEEQGEDNEFAEGEVSALASLLLENGWGWVAGLR